MGGPLDDYMTQLERELRRRGIDDPRMLAEAREHLVDAIDAGRQRGLSAADAEREALDRFGAPRIVAGHMLEARSRTAGRFKTALGIAWQRKWWIAVPTVCAAIVAAVLSQFVMPPAYRAQTLILVEPQRVVPGDDRRVIVLPDRDAQIRRINSLVLSRSRLEAVIQDLDLYREERTREPLIEVVDRMARDIRVTAAQDNIFRLSFVSNDPRTAVRVTERLARYLIEEHASERAAIIGMTSRFLDAEIEDVRRRLTEQEAVLQERRRQNGGQPSSEADLLYYEMLRKRYTALLVKREDSKVAEQLELRYSGERVRILDSARATPEGPNWPPLTLLGALGGLVVGLALAFLRPSGAASPPPTLAEA